MLVDWREKTQHTTYFRDEFRHMGFLQRPGHLPPRPRLRIPILLHPHRSASGCVEEYPGGGHRIQCSTVALA